MESLTLKELESELGRPAFLQDYIRSTGAQLGDQDAKRLGHRAETLVMEARQNLGFRDSDKVRLYSVPGRIRLLGFGSNFLGGTVLNQTIQRDAIGLVRQRRDVQVNVASYGFDQVTHIEVDRLEHRESEIGTSEAIIRGVAAQLHKKKVPLHGFDAVVHSTVPPGAEMSSSSCYSILMALIFADLAGEIPGQYPEPASAELMVGAAQEAEQHWFGKHAALSDIWSCALGGLMAYDYTRKRHLELPSGGESATFCLLDTYESHEGLEEERAAVTIELRGLSRAIAAESEVILDLLDAESILESAHELRNICGDRAILRAMHFFDEKDRVTDAIGRISQGSLAVGDLTAIFNASGESSWRLLENVHQSGQERDRGIGLAIELIRRFGRDHSIDVGVRVHERGFAGAVLACLEPGTEAGLVQYLEKIFGRGSLRVLHPRSRGAVRLY